MATRKYEQFVEAEIEEKSSAKEKVEQQHNKNSQALETAAKPQPMEPLEKWADDIIGKKLGKKKARLRQHGPHRGPRAHQLGEGDTPKCDIP